MHWATELIGHPWQADGEGPHAFNCRTFVRHVQKEQYQNTLPEIPIDGNNLRKLAKAFKNHPEYQRWQQISDPQDGDCVLLRQARYPVHVGIWLEADGGGILHCVKSSGVVFQRVGDLERHGWQIAGYYRFIGDVR